jgi:hypothetical protein
MSLKTELRVFGLTKDCFRNSGAVLCYCPLIYKYLKEQTLLTVIKRKLTLQTIDSFCESPYNLIMFLKLCKFYIDLIFL